MIEQFKKLPADDQQNLIDVCLDEFGEKGYEGASTNVIVKNAGIPKGTLFFFFGNKKNLFLYLLDYAVEEYVAYIDTQTTTLPSDPFDRLLHLSSVRLRFAAHAPRVYTFFFRTLLNIPDELKADMQERFQRYSKENQKFMRDGLDTSRLREGVSIDQALKLLNIFMEGLLTRYTDQLIKMDIEDTIPFVENRLKESLVYFDLIKNGVYAN